MVMVEMEEVLGKLTDRMQIKRDHGVSLLQSLLDNAGNVQRQEVWSVGVVHVKKLISSEEWESRHGGFCAAKVLVLWDGEATFANELVPEALLHLQDPEPGVRLAAGECLYALGKKQDSALYLQCIKDCVLQCIEDGFDGERGMGDETGQNGEKSFQDKLDHVQHNSNHTSTGGGLSDIHQRAKGGRYLETSVKALQRLLDGCGDSFSVHVTPQLWQLLLKALQHQNRFVRETGFLCISSLCQVSPLEVLQESGESISNGLALGLSDNWSQVRFAASIATRTFMQRTQQFNPIFYPMILPAMCLNRYYGAEGLRLYSQDSWQMLMGSTGRDEVAKSVDNFLDYYVTHASAENRLVREAACHCIAELLVKIDPERIKPLISQVLATLMGCFKDSSWAVRDAACSALGKAITGFAQEVRCFLPALFDLLFAHLADNVGSVRENSAFTLGSTMRSYQEEAIDKVILALEQLLPMAKHQVDKPCCCNGAKHRSPCSSTIHTKWHDPLSKLDSDFRTTSAIALVVASKGNGDDDQGFAREIEPWESSEGGIYLLRELSAVAPSKATKFLPVLVELAQSSGYVKYHNLMETLFRLLPSIAQNLGKRNFKPYLELFIDPLFQALTCGQRLSESASSYCISKLCTFIGPNIFKARLNSSQLAIMESSSFVVATISAPGTGTEMKESQSGEDAGM
ncbi:unnamed protein product [Sphagnum balticum]